MLTRTRRIVAAIVAVLGLGMGSAVLVASSASAAPAVPPTCTAGDLGVWVNINSGGAAAGTDYYALEFTNTSNHACRTIGYPGVSATNANTKQLGDAAGKNPLYKAAYVTIPAGGTAHVLFGYASAEVFTSGCKPANASFLRVYPPNQKSSSLTFFSLPVCTVAHHTYLFVSVMRPGTNI
jgi:Protein of unknown function (DUF4232)